MKRLPFAQTSIFLITIFSLAAITCSSTSRIPNPFATATPSPTATSTSTPSPTPTSTPTLTPTPLPTGTVHQLQPDGTTLFTDYDNKFEVVFPAGWTAISLTPKDLNYIFTLAAKDNPELESTLTDLKSLDPKVFRGFAFDFRPEHMINGYPANITVTAQSNSLINGMSLKNVVDETTQSLPQLFKGIKVLSSKVTTNGSNIPIGIIETNLSIATANGSKLRVYEQVVILKISEVVVSITLAVPTSRQKDLLPDFEEVIDSIKLLE
jgi:hypothetical protein